MGLLSIIMQSLMGVWLGYSLLKEFMGGETSEETTTRQKKSAERKHMAVLSDAQTFKSKIDEMKELDPGVLDNLMSAIGNIRGGRAYVPSAPEGVFTPPGDETGEMSQLGPDPATLLATMLGDAGGQPVSPERLTRAMETPYPGKLPWMAPYAKDIIRR